MFQTVSFSAVSSTMFMSRKEYMTEIFTEYMVPVLLYRAILFHLLSHVE